MLQIQFKSQVLLIEPTSSVIKACDHQNLWAAYQKRCNWTRQSMRRSPSIRPADIERIVADACIEQSDDRNAMKASRRVISSKVRTLMPGRALCQLWGTQVKWLPQHPQLGRSA